MNLPSENKSNNEALQKLKQTTEEAVQTVTETPYQSIVYAIPKEDWKVFLEYMKGTSDFQPTLYEEFQKLERTVLTKEDWNTLMRALNEWANLVGEEVTNAADETSGKMQKILAESRELLTRDRKTRDGFFFDLHREVNGQIGKIERLLLMMKKWIWITLLTNAVLTSVLSLVIYLLMK